MLAGVHLVGPAPAWAQPATPRNGEVLIGTAASGELLSGDTPDRPLLVTIDTPYQVYDQAGTFIHVAAWTIDGEPAANASVYLSSHLVGRTDAQGSLVFRWGVPGNSVEDYWLNGSQVAVRWESEGASHGGEVWFSAMSRTASFESDHLYVYTDRGIYNPGQAIHIRSIAWHLAVDWSPLADQPIEYLLNDPQGRTVQGASLTTNELGIAATDLSLPEHAEEGLYELVASYNGATATARLRVERFVAPIINIDHTLGRFLTRDQAELAFDVNLAYFSGGEFDSGTIRVDVLSNDASVYHSESQVSGAGPHHFSIAGGELDAIRNLLYDGQHIDVQIAVEDPYGRQDDLKRDMTYTANPYIAIIEKDRDYYSTGDAIELVVRLTDIERVPVRNTAVRLTTSAGATLTATTDEGGTAQFSLTMPGSDLTVEVFLEGVATALASSYITWQEVPDMRSHIADAIVEENEPAHVEIAFPSHFVPAESVVHMDVVDTSGSLVNAVLIPITNEGGRYRAEGSFTAPSWGSMLLTFFCLGRDSGDRTSSTDTSTPLGLMTEGQNLVVHPARELTITLDGVPDALAPSRLFGAGRVTDTPGQPGACRAGRLGGRPSGDFSQGSAGNHAHGSLLQPRAPRHLDDRLGDPHLARGQPQLGHGHPRHRVAAVPLPGWWSVGLTDAARSAVHDGHGDGWRACSHGANAGNTCRGERNGAHGRRRRRGVRHGNGRRARRAGHGDDWWRGGLSRRGRRGACCTAGHHHHPHRVSGDVAVGALMMATSGTAQLGTLPDAITVQEIAIVASDASGGVGLLRMPVRVTQPVFVQSDLPDTLNVGDEIAARVAVQNLTEEDRIFEVSLASSDLTVSGPATMSLEVAAGQTGVASFQVVATGAGFATYTASARAAERQDLEERVIYVRPVGLPAVTSIDGVLTAAAPFSATVTIPEGGQLTTLALNVAFPAVSAAFAGLDALGSEMRHDDLLSTGGELIATALLYGYQRQQGAPNEILQPMKETIEAILGEILMAQRPDGGWGFWWDAASSPYITGYCIEALGTLMELDFFVPPTTMTRAIDYLAASRGGEQTWDQSAIAFWEGNTEAVRLGLTAEIFDILAGVPEPVRASGSWSSLVGGLATYFREYLDHDSPEVLTYAHAVLGLYRLSQAGVVQIDSARLTQAAQRLDDLRQEGHWEPSWFNAYGGTIEATVTVLEVFQALGGDWLASAERDAVRYLLSTRDEWGGWHNPRGTAAAIRGLLILDPGGIEVASSVVVRVDGEEVARVAIDPSDPFLSAVSLRALDLSAFARAGTHSVEVAYDGRLEPDVRVVMRHWEAAAPSDADGFAAQHVHGELRGGGGSRHSLHHSPGVHRRRSLRRSRRGLTSQRRDRSPSVAVAARAGS
jgi:hypothetical protein